VYYRLALKHHRQDVKKIQLYYDSLEQKTLTSTCRSKCTTSWWSTARTLSPSAHLKGADHHGRRCQLRG
jgi:hypothetical protein